MNLWTDQETRRRPPPAAEPLRAKMERQLRELLDPDVATVVRGIATVVEVLAFPAHFDVRCPACGPHPPPVPCAEGCPCLCHDAPVRGNP